MNNQNIEQYIQQLMALQQKNQNEQITKKELDEIAQRLGFDITEINKAKENYITTGNNYFKFGNYEDALKEFLQAIILDNQNPEILYALASCHKGLFHQKNQRKDKEQAIDYAKKVVKIDPNHQKAFALISSFQENNNVPKEFNKQFVPNRNNSFAVAFILGIVGFLGISGIIAFIFSTIPMKSQDFTKTGDKIVQQKSIATARNLSIARVTGGLYEDKSYVWAIYYTQNYEHNTYVRSYKANIIDAKTKQTKEIELKSGLNFMNSIYEQGESRDGKMYFLAKDFYEVRDLKTGEIVENKVILANKFPQLKDGIADIENYSSNSGWFIVTTRKNDKYYYHPKSNKLIPEKEQSQHKGWAFRWYANNNKKNIETEFMLIGEETNLLYVYDHLKTSVSIMNKNSWEDTKLGKNRYGRKKVVVLNGSFLGGEMIYGDEKYFFGRYFKEEQEDNQVEKKGKDYIYFCADVATGKILWQKSFVNETSVVLANLDNIHTTKPQVVNNKMALITQILSLPNAQAFAITTLDLQTGEVLINYAEKR